MEIDLTTPALLFSAISLIMLAYTNRFLSYAQLVRTLKEQYMENPSSVKAAQIANLRKRLYLTRAMQVAGIGSDAEMAGMGGLDGELANDRVSLGGPQSIMLPSPSEGYDAQLNAIKSLVAEDPGRVAQVVKEWINADE